MRKFGRISFPFQTGVIDVGAHAVRLDVFEVTAAGRVRLLETLSRTSTPSLPRPLAASHAGCTDAETRSPLRRTTTSSRPVVQVFFYRISHPYSGGKGDRISRRIS